MKVLWVRALRWGTDALIIERGIYRRVSMRQAEHELALIWGCETLLDCQKIMVLISILLDNWLLCIFYLLCQMQHITAYLLFNSGLRWISLLFTDPLMNRRRLFRLPWVGNRWLSLNHELILWRCRRGRLTLCIANEGQMLEDLFRETLARLFVFD